MDLLGGYDSDSDGNAEITLPTVKSVSVTVTASSSSSSSSSSTAPVSVDPSAAAKVSGGKKVKKLDISVLPEAIQMALQRGDDANDSESDDDLEIYKTRVGSKDPIVSNGGNSYNNLLSQLPQPKKAAGGKSAFSKSATTATATAKENHSEKSVPPTALKPDSIKHPTPMVYKEEEEEDDHHSLFTFAAPLSTNSTSSSSHLSMPPPSIAAPITARPVTSDFNSNNNSNEFSNSIYNVSNMQQQSINYNNNNNNNSFDGSEMHTTASKRKREIEQQLMNGNISVLGENSAQLFDINGGNADWAQEQYMEKKAIEKQILSQYHVNDGTMKQITAVNSRRHQINSLVANAAKTELQLLEKGGGGHRKAETRAKYGW